MSFRTLSLLVIAAFLLALAPGAGFPAAPDTPPDLAPTTVTRNPLGRVWRAKWIWIPGEPAPKNSYVYFRKTFSVDDPSQTTRVYLTADSRYELYLNGKRVAHGPVRSDRRWLYYD